MASRERSGIAMRVARGVAVLGVAAGLVVAGTPALVAYTQTHPERRLAPPLVGFAPLEIAFASARDGLVLRGWYLSAPARSGTTLVLAPGILSNRALGGMTQGLAGALLGAGYDLLAFDFRAEGSSDGDTLSFGAREQDDLLGAVAEARRRGARRVVVLGTSMGGAAALLAAARSPAIDAVIADSVFADLTTTLRERMRVDFRFPDVAAPYVLALSRLFSGTDPAGVRPLAAIAAMEQPVLLVAGTADAVVDPADARALARAAGSRAELYLVPGAGHVGAFATDPSTYTRRLLAFLARTGGR